MAASTLNSPRAIQMSVFVVRAFVHMRRAILVHAQMAERLAEMERRVIGHDEAIRSLVRTIRQLMAPTEKTRRSIGFAPGPPRGFKVEERRPGYRRRRQGAKV